MTKEYKNIFEFILQVSTVDDNFETSLKVENDINDCLLVGKN
jgi:hypothetical protein